MSKRSKIRINLSLKGVGHVVTTMTMIIKHVISMTITGMTMAMLLTNTKTMVKAIATIITVTW